ncbi:MAG: PQQ-binding-like beta-propeller repeat protein [Candidatus Magnetoovum sp. WYHC-5]|nr:PQQ-binding-like beta-propeller repeat protein [Candidatus Magnetoovum sp. WYHC-5]
MVKKFKRCLVFSVIIIGLIVLYYIYKAEIKQKICNICLNRCYQTQQIQKENPLEQPLELTNPAGVGQTPHPLYRTNSRRTGASPFKGPKRAIIKWRFPIDGLIEASPVIGIDGNIYVSGDNGSFYTLSRNGKLLWKFKTWDMNRNSPAIALDGTIYLPSSDHNIYALTPTGRLKWFYRTDGRINSSPVIDKEGIIYFGAQDKHLYALNPDGSLQWKTAIGAISASSPALSADGKTIYIGSYDNHVYALHTDGKLKWKLKLDGGIRTTPAIGSDGTIYIGSREGIFYALSPSGAIKWTFKTSDDIRASAAIWTNEEEDIIYVGSWDKHIYALNSKGDVVWRYKTNGPIEAAPVVDSEGNVYVASITDKLYSFNQKGIIRWTLNGGMLNTASAIDNDGTMYISIEHTVVAVGEPYPQVEINDSGSANLTIKLINSALTDYKTDLKVFAKDSAGRDISIANNNEVTISAEKTVESHHMLPLELTQGGGFVTVRLLDSLDGTLYSEKSIQLKALEVR